MKKNDADEEDLFSLDFTKIVIDDEPEPEPVAEKPAPLSFEPQPPAQSQSPQSPQEPQSPSFEPPPLTFAPAPATKPAGGVEDAEPAAPTAFETFKAPLALVDVVAPPPAAQPPATESTQKTKTAALPPAPGDANVAPAVPTPAAKKTPSQSRPLFEIARQHAAGKSAEASSALEAALRAGTLGKATEQGWGMMFDLLQVMNRRQAFENLADAYAKRFEKSAPAWQDPAGEPDDSLETGGAAYIALSGALSAASASALSKLAEIAESKPVVRLGLLKVTDADNDGCGLLLQTLRAIKKAGRECLLSGAEGFAAMLADKVEMMKREREETWLLLLELYQRIGNQTAFEDTAVAYAVTFEVSPPSWENEAPSKAKAKPAAAKSKDPFTLEGELLAGMNSISTLAQAAQGRDAITIETDHLSRIDEVSVKLLIDALAPLHAQGMHIRIRGANLLVATLLAGCGLDKIASIETRRR